MQIEKSSIERLTFVMSRLTFRAIAKTCDCGRCRSLARRCVCPGSWGWTSRRLTARCGSWVTCSSASTTLSSTWKTSALASRAPFEHARLHWPSSLAPALPRQRSSNDHPELCLHPRFSDTESVFFLVFQIGTAFIPIYVYILVVVDVIALIQSRYTKYWYLKKKF